jgi:flagellar P-ring protein precursor FlgI
MLRRSCVLMLLCVLPLLGARIKEIASIEGTQGMPLVGYGLVSGLNNTGDSPRAAFTVQSVVNMLRRFGVNVADATVRTRNVAAVMVTATLPAFAKPGMRLDVQVSSPGGRGISARRDSAADPVGRTDGTVYAVAQGAVSVGGYAFRALGSLAARNFVASGRVPGGALVERESPMQLAVGEQIRILLHQPDFTVATRVADAIGRIPGLNGAASALDAATVVLRIPTGTPRERLLQWLAQVENAEVELEPPARVVINERTGTIVVGGSVRLLPAVVAHGGLEVQIQRQVIISQPAPLTLGTTQVAETATIAVQQEQRRAVALPAAATVQDVAAALNLLGVSPRDLIAILQALKEAGALTGELIVQ